MTIRLTFSTTAVMQAVAAGNRHGFDIMDATGLPDGTVYPALRRLQHAGYLSSQWEDEKRAFAKGRPARRNYKLTPVGRKALAEGRSRYKGLARLATRPSRGRESV